MLYSIENDRLRVEINDIGAELYSIKDKADGFEYLLAGRSAVLVGQSI